MGCLSKYEQRDVPQGPGLWAARVGSGILYAVISSRSSLGVHDFGRFRTVSTRARGWMWTWNSRDRETVSGTDFGDRMGVVADSSRNPLSTRSMWRATGADGAGFARRYWLSPNSANAWPLQGRIDIVAFWYRSAGYPVPWEQIKSKSCGSFFLQTKSVWVFIWSSNGGNKTKWAANDSVAFWYRSVRALPSGGPK